MIINPWIFYLISICNIIHVVCAIVFLISAAFLLLWSLGLGMAYDEEKHKINSETIDLFKKFLKRFIVLSAVSFLGMTFIPSESTATKMLIASQVNETNAERAKEVVNYIVEKIQEVRE